MNICNVCHVRLDPVSWQMPPSFTFTPFPCINGHILKTYGLVLKKEDQNVLLPIWDYRAPFWERIAREIQLTLGTFPEQLPGTSNAEKGLWVGESHGLTSVTHLRWSDPFWVAQNHHALCEKASGSVPFHLHSSPLLPDMIRIPSKPCVFSKTQLSRQQQRERGKEKGGKKLSLIILPIMNSCPECAASMCFQSSADGSLAGGHFQEAVDITDEGSYWQELLSVFLPV